MIDFLVVPLSDLVKDKSRDQLNNLEELLSTFKCKLEPDLEYFLDKKSIEYELTGYGKTFLILDENEIKNKNFKIVAFFTTSQTSLEITSLSKKKRRKVIGNSIPGRDNLESIPAYLIGQIGRDDSYKHSDLPGEIILQECYQKINEARKVVGGSLLLLECRPVMFDLFYRNQGFLQLDVELSTHNVESDDELLTLYKKFS